MAAPPHPDDDLPVLSDDEILEHVDSIKSGESANVELKTLYSINVGQNYVLEIIHNTNRAIPDSSIMTTMEGDQVGSSHEVGVNDANLNINKQDEKQNQSNSNYGWIEIEKIINSSDTTVNYVNPYQGVHQDT